MIPQELIRLPPIGALGSHEEGDHCAIATCSCYEYLDDAQVDAHILCTPVIADIDQDGHAELVVAASYFYDREFYDLPVSTHANI